jgi:hypothetical protein
MSPGQRQASPDLDPPAIQGAPMNEFMRSQVEMQQQQQVQQPVQPAQQPDPNGRRRPRTKGEVDADVQALSEAIKQHNTAEEGEAEPAAKSDESIKSETAEDDYGYDSLFWEGGGNKLNTLARRKRIEERCKPMDLEDYIMNGGVKQRVPIIPGKIEPTFRTADVDEDLSVKRIMFGVEGTDIYISNRFSLMQLTLALFAFNGEPLPSHLDENEKFNEKLFNEKFAKIRKYPIHLAEDLVQNYLWFDDRVKELFNEDLGNG